MLVLEGFKDLFYSIVFLIIFNAGLKNNTILNHGMTLSNEAVDFRTFIHMNKVTYAFEIFANIFKILQVNEDRF